MTENGGRGGGINVVKIARELLTRVQHDDVTLLAAALAYRFFLALFPFFIFLAALGGFAADVLRIRNPTLQLVSMMSDTLPPELSRLIRDELSRVVESQDPYFLSLGIIGAVVFATGGTNAIIRAMNRAYDVEETRPAWKRYPLAAGLTILAGLTVIGAFVLFVLGQILGSTVAARFGFEGQFWIIVQYARWPGAFAFLLLVVTTVYWAAPNRRLSVRWVLPGGVLFVLGWLVATYLFGLYVSSLGSYGATYGALAGAAILLIWFYLIALALLVGAELNAIVDREIDAQHAQREGRASRAEAARQRAGRASRGSDGSANESERAASQDEDDRELSLARSTERGEPLP